MITPTYLTREQVEARDNAAALRSEEDALLADLAATDWYVARQAETRKKIPEDIAAKRQEARDRISAIRIELGE